MVLLGTGFSDLLKSFLAKLQSSILKAKALGKT